MITNTSVNSDGSLLTRVMIIDTSVITTHAYYNHNCDFVFTGNVNVILMQNVTDEAEMQTDIIPLLYFIFLFTA